MSKSLSDQIKRTAPNVRAEIARSGLSQTDIATSLSLSQTAVSRRLSGKVDFSASELTKLAALLNVPVATFFGESSKVAS